MKYFNMITILALTTTSFFTSNAYSNDIPIRYDEIHTQTGTYGVPVFELDGNQSRGLFSYYQNSPDGERSFYAEMDPDYAMETFTVSDLSTEQKSLKSIMSPVRDQGRRGTCSVFAAIGILETFFNQDFSEQCLAKFSSPDDGGWTQARLKYVQETGLYDESDCPYNKNDRDNIPNIGNAEITKVPHAFEVHSKKVGDPIDYIKNRLRASSPVGISVYVAGNWEGPFIYMPTQEETEQSCKQVGAKTQCPGHAIVVTGFNETVELLEIRNSWSASWGKEGYGFMSYEYYRQLGYGDLISY